MTRALSLFPMMYPRRDPSQVRDDQFFVDEVMRLWDRKLDTAEIAKRLSEREAVVCVALQAGREQRRQGSG